MADNTLAIPQPSSAEIWMPVLDLATAVRRHNFMTQVAQTLMVEGTDYGAIPGTGSKPTLLKPGAERLCTVFGMSPEVYEEKTIEDWDGSGEGHGEPLFYYRYKCRLTKNGVLLGEGIGSCNSRESKYRYRAAERKCPKCGSAAIIRGKEEYGGGWVCFARKGGCGAKFKMGDSAIEGQSAGRVINPDVADVVNTIQKMAHKRALVAAVLIATNASEFYTQDVEEMEVIEVPPERPEPEEKPWRTFKGMIEEFGKLKAQLGAERESTYYDILGLFGVKHANEFRDSQKALAAYHDLEFHVTGNFPPAPPQEK
jgi:predicted RNA-binding Zn-ribbon protein involved in translation (DUF1610 family)